MPCTHSESNDRWVPSWTDDEGYEHNGHWEKHTKSFFVDTGIHTYKCTRCNETFYYSERARIALTGGTPV
jgi:hypothetical protein